MAFKKNANLQIVHFGQNWSKYYYLLLFMPERARCDYVLQPAHISELGGTSLAVERHVNAKKN